MEFFLSHNVIVWWYFNVTPPNRGPFTCHQSNLRFEYCQWDYMWMYVCMYVCIHGWMNVCRDIISAYKNAWMDGWVEGCMDQRKKNGQYTYLFQEWWRSGEQQMSQRNEQREEEEDDDDEDEEEGTLQRKGHINNFIILYA